MKIERIAGIFTICIFSSLSAAPAIHVFAAGLTYRKHIRDSAEKVSERPVIFEKNPRSYLAAESFQSVTLPSEKLIYERLEKLKARLANEVSRKFENFPTMLDYESELGIVFTRRLSRADIEERKSLSNAIAFFSADDLSMRSVQVLGDQQDNKLDYWSTAKSFTGFMPHSQPKPVQDFSLSKWPLIAVRSWVNGELRQNDTTADMVYSPRNMLLALFDAVHQDSLPAGTALLTGTPAGPAFKVSPLKKFLANVLHYSPLKKLEITAAEAEKNPKFLKAGDSVICEVVGVGINRVVIVP